MNQLRAFCFVSWSVAAGLALTVASGSHGRALDEADPVTRHAAGSFEVSVRPESETRFAMTKRFAGAMVGTSQGTMIGDRVVDAYVALERFEGTLDGREGGFVLLHRGYKSDAEGMTLDIEVAPNSGTGGLAGIRGRLAISIEGGKHLYDLSYSLPSR